MQRRVNIWSHHSRAVQSPSYRRTNLILEFDTGYCTKSHCLCQLMRYRLIDQSVFTGIAVFVTLHSDWPIGTDVLTECGLGELYILRVLSVIHFR